MANKILIVYLVFIILFALTGSLLIAFPLVMQAALNAPATVDTVARNLILDRCPLTASVINAIIVFTTALLTLPALAMSTTRSFLKIQGYLITTCAFLSLTLGLFLWYDTLQTRSNLASVYGESSREVQSLLQEKFECCGYLSASSPEYVKDGTCPGAIQAAMMTPCVGPLSRYANGIEDVIFTAMFGVVGLDVLAILAITMLLKDRKERERYRYIDMKGGKLGF